MLNLYKETVLEVKRAASSKRIEITIPRANGSYDRSKFSQKPKRSDRLATDDKSYAAEYLATASSVFFRKAQSYPRSFLWRIVSNQKLLEIANADFARSEKDAEANVGLAFEFQDKIAPHGVTICDVADSNEFHIFVLTQENEVFEIHLHTDFFQQPKSVPKDTKSWCSPIRASALSIDKAFRIHADSPNDLFISFASSAISHWKRNDTQSQWSHANYDERKLVSSLVSIVTRSGHANIDFDGLALAYNTAHGMVRSGHYLFTICLNHDLQIWNLKTGRAQSMDLLDQVKESTNTLRQPPAEPGYIQFLEGANKHEQILLTCSRSNGAQVKLWRVRNAFEDDSRHFAIEDMVPKSTLFLPDPDPTGATVWALSGLQAIFDKHTKDWQLWVLWRNHNYHKAYSLNFGFADISNQWQKDWVAALPTHVKAQGPDFVTADAQDVTSKWLEYILFPGRYSSAVIETALTQLVNVLDVRLSSIDRKKSMQERMEKIIMSQIKLREYDDSTMDYDRYARDADQQWRQFWRMLESMNEGRYAPLALAVDSSTEMIFLMMADIACVVRECSDYELVQSNYATELEALPQLFRTRWPYRKVLLNMQEAGSVSIFLSAAHNFFSSFPPELAADFLQTVEEDLFTKSDIPTPQRIVNFFNLIDFGNAMPDDVEKAFMKDLSSIGGLSAITSELYTASLRLIAEHKKPRGKPHHVKTTFGVQLMSIALLNDILALKEMVLSMLAVVVWVDESEAFETAKYFDDLIQRLATQERNLWLATHYRSSKPQGSDDPETVSILQDLFAQSLRPHSADHHPMPYLLTQHIKENMDFISAKPWLPEEEASVFLQCDLLRRGDVQLATDFLKFQPPTPFSTYVKGRLNLALGSYKEASVYFRDAADGLATGKALGKLEEISSGLLTADEAACFFSGLPLYFQHILGLFEAQQAHSEAAEIAQLILHELERSKNEPVVNFKQSILHRLFAAELKCLRFDAAFSALVRSSDPVLQRASATELIDTMLDSATSLTSVAGIVQRLQKMPFSAHPHLAHHVDHHLASLAKKQISIPSAGGVWLSNTPVDYLSILHALRISRKDYRGAVSVLFDRLRIIQKSGRARSDPAAIALRHALLALINALTCVSQDEAYILADSSEDPRIGGTSLKRLRGQEDNQSLRRRRRVIITLDDLRREYQKVLDRCSRIERGDFEYGEEDGSDDDDEEEVDSTWQGSKLIIDQNRSNGVLARINGNGMDLS